MRIALALRIVLLLLTSSVISSCATVIEGTTDKIRYDGGPGALTFYDDQGKQIPSEHEYDERDDLHYNFIELDKRQDQHVITARYGKMMQVDTLRRKYAYGWLIPNALLIYPFPVFTGIDLLSSSAYSFTPPRLHLSPRDTIMLPDPSVVTLGSAAAERYEKQKIMVSLHSGMLTPVFGNVDYPPAYGITGGYYLGNRLWTTVGYNYSAYLEQKLGRAERLYTTTVHSAEATLQYNPLRFAYLLGGIGFDHMIYQLAAKQDDPKRRFGRNVISASFGAGAYFGGLFLEWRRNFGLAPIETPEGPGHNVQFTHIRFGVVMRFNK